MADIGAVIIGVGSYLPQQRLTNQDLSRMVETNDEWIVQRTGIRERRIAAPTDTTASMATAAARQALDMAALKPGDLDLIVCATITPEMQFPATACFVAANLGLNSTPAFDVSAACSGFIYGLDTAVSFIKADRYRCALVMGSETLSRATDYKDRASCILFGDGAGAVVLRRTNDSSRGVIYSSLYADGTGWEMLHCRPGSRYPIDETMLAERGQFMKIKGREVYKFAVSRFTELIQDAMRKCSLSPEQIKLVIPHQVNQRIIDSAIAKLGFAPDKAFVNIDKYGNTSSASIPIALDEAWRSGRIQSGDVLIFVAFGAGLTWANAVVRV
jgi:3-oxoacyl-[acyl-carrier-protein] synthase-3